MVALKTLFFLSLGASQAFAAQGPPPVVCSTRLGHSSVANPTTKTVTSTQRTTNTKKITQTVSATVTPKAKTVYLTDYTTITTTKTGIASTSTTTKTLTDTSTAVVGTTAFETKTETTGTTSTSTSTTTVWAPTGYRGISRNQDQIWPKRRDGVSKNERRGRYQGYGPGRYPQNVDCTRVVVQTATTTVVVPSKSKQTVTLAPSTVTARTTKTSTETTSVNPPDVVESVIQRTVIITSITSDVTSTTTTTVTTSIPTVVTVKDYYGCRDENLMSALSDGTPIGKVDIPEGAEVTDTEAKSAYDCCVACFDRGETLCQGSFFAPASKTCSIIQSRSPPGSCNSRFNLQYKYRAGRTPSGGYTVSNGPCGEILNGGPLQVAGS